jgi:NAD(P)-dependent dehydrogenase (short-subunit alcohol dehydrogenase family)
MSKLAGRTAWVTGAGAGIGAAAARALAAAGAHVFVTDIDATAASRTAQEILRQGGSASGSQLDVSDEASWARAWVQLQAARGALHVLVNNAGVATTGDMIETLALADWRRSMAVNLDGVFLGTRLGIRAMKQNASTAPGSIVNVSSVYGLVGTTHAADYVAAKGGVRLLTKAAALECCQARYSIRVNSIHPGYVRTPMLERGMSQFAARGMFADAEAGLAAVTSLHPIGRLGAPEEIGAAIVFLASDDSQLMTGAELVVDGGFPAQ